MRGTRLVGRHLGTFRAAGRGNALNGRFSFTASSGHGVVVGTLGGTRDSSRCMIHICRAKNRGSRRTALSFTNSVLGTGRTSNARGAVNATGFGKGGLRIAVGPCSIGAFGIHLGDTTRPTSRPRCMGLPLGCSHGYTSFGRFHKRTGFRSKCSCTTRLLPSSVFTSRVPFHLKRGRAFGNVAYGKSAVCLPSKRGCARLCFLTTTASSSCSIAFYYKGGGTRVAIPSCANFVKR